VGGWEALAARCGRAEGLLARREPWVGGAFLLGLLAVLGVRIARAPDLGDTRFYRQGALEWWAGEDLYFQDPPFRPGHPRNVTTSYTYPPPFAVASLWMAPLPYPLVRVVWLLLMLALLVLLVRATARLVATRGPPPWPRLTMTLGLLLVGRFIYNDLAHGQTNVLVSALLVHALLWAEEGRSPRAGVALALALVIKPTSWPLVPFFLLVRRDMRLVGACVAAAAVALLLPGLRYGAAYVEVCANWLHLMQLFAEDTARHPNNAALGASIARLAAGAVEKVEEVVPLWGSLDAGASIRAGRLTAGLVALGGLGWLAWRRPKSPEAPAAVLVLGALLSPVTWKAHLTVLLIPGAFLARRSLEGGRLATACLGLCVALFLLPSRGLLDLRVMEAHGSLSLGLLVLFLGLAMAAPSGQENRGGTEDAPP
jgi:hypothetical protein